MLLGVGVTVPPISTGWIPSNIIPQSCLCIKVQRQQSSTVCTYLYRHCFYLQDIYNLWWHLFACTCPSNPRRFDNLLEKVTTCHRFAIVPSGTYLHYHAFVLKASRSVLVQILAGLISERLKATYYSALFHGNTAYPHVSRTVCCHMGNLYTSYIGTRLKLPTRQKQKSVVVDTTTMTLYQIIHSSEVCPSYWNKRAISKFSARFDPKFYDDCGDPEAEDESTPLIGLLCMIAITTRLWKSPWRTSPQVGALSTNPCLIMRQSPLPFIANLDRSIVSSW